MSSLLSRSYCSGGKGWRKLYSHHSPKFLANIETNDMTVASGVCGHRSHSQFSAGKRKDPRYKIAEGICYKDLRIEEQNLDYFYLEYTKLSKRFFLKYHFENSTDGLSYIINHFLAGR